MQKGQFPDFRINAFQYHRHGLHLRTKRPCAESKRVPCYYLDETSGGMLFFHFSFIWCLTDLAINTCLFSIMFFFFKRMIVFFRQLFLENNFARCKLFRWSVEILAVGKAKRNQPTLTSTPTVALLRFPLCHEHVPFAVSLHTAPWDFPGLLYLLLLG